MTSSATSGVSWAIACIVWVAGAAPPARAEPERTARGFVVEVAGARDGRPVPSAMVVTDRGVTALTDRDGYFALAVGPDDREITITATGYGTRTLSISDDVMHIELAALASGEVIEVAARAPEPTRALVYQLTADEIRTIPGAANDVLRALQAMPGVARIPFAFGALVLRGTSPRDTAVYLDGVTVPLAFHFGGITSFYPSGMLADVTLTEGGFDASFGRAQGGLVTLTTREPRGDRWRLGGELGLFDSNVQAEGPLPGHGSIILGVRRSYLDAVAGPFVADDVELPSYWDFQIRGSWGDPRGSGRISPMIFASIDRDATETLSLTSAFLRVAAPYTRSWGATTLRVVPWLGWQTLAFDDHSTEVTETLSRPSERGGLRAELVHDTAWGHLRGGAELDGGRLSYAQENVSGKITIAPFPDGSSIVRWTDVAAWSELGWKLAGERLALRPGVRVERYGLTGETVVDPRLNVQQKLTGGVTLRQAIGRYHQPPTPADVDPRSGNVALRSSYYDQASLGIDAALAMDLAASLTGFYSAGAGLGVEVSAPRGGYSSAPNRGGLGPTFQLLLESQLGFTIYRDNVGRGRSYGAELALKRSAADWFAMASYTLSKSERMDDPRLAMGWRPFELDQRHNLNLVAAVTLASWRLGARLQVVSGDPYRPEQVSADGSHIEVGPWTPLPVFVALDLRVDHSWHPSWGEVKLYLDVQNATNRRNIEGRGFDSSLGRDADAAGLPILPFLGVEVVPR